AYGSCALIAADFRAGRVAIPQHYLVAIQAVGAPLREFQELLCAAEAWAPRKAKMRKARMTVEQANAEAKKTAHKFGKGFFALSESKQADLIGCHWQTWTKTSFYATAKRRKLLGESRQPSSPKSESLTFGREAVVGQGDKDAVLKKLIADQEADPEPS